MLVFSCAFCKKFSEQLFPRTPLSDWFDNYDAVDADKDAVVTKLWLYDHI